MLFHSLSKTVTLNAKTVEFKIFSQVLLGKCGNNTKVFPNAVVLVRLQKLIARG